MFQKVAIIGVGLIGGSLGLEIKRKKLARSVVGCGRSGGNLRVALKRHLIDRATTDFATAVWGADLVILAVPVKTIIGLIGPIGPVLKPGAIVMDVASTKAEVLRSAEKQLPRNVFFVGAHPLAGTEQAGAGAALPGLFRGKTCLLTPRRNTPLPVVRKVRRFWQTLGAKTEILPAGAHDRILAVTSHLPQMAAYALMNASASLLPPAKIAGMSGGGFRDTTRIAASPAGMWLDIALSNRHPLLRGLNLLRRELQRIETALKKNDGNSLLRYFSKAANLRRKIPPTPL